jgi:hypothetical protein
MIQNRGFDKLASPEVVLPDFPSRRRILCQGGSLPLKKRRFFRDISLDQGRDTTSSKEECQTNSQSLAQRDQGDDEKMAALVLVASATSPSINPSATDILLALTPEPPTFKVTSPLSSPATLISVQPFIDSDNLSPSSMFRRLNQPRLASPLPNGCHGRTSRNNSYCRRQPCYNGSNYCKLHYQQYIVSGVRSPEQPSPVTDKLFLSLLDDAPAIPNIMHQDKRYTGTGDEVRCLATTTRGRACAYVVVGSTKYCYLHADYDTNPPPRRGGAALRKLEKQGGRTSPTCAQKIGPVLASKEDGNNPAVKSEKVGDSTNIHSFNWKRSTLSSSFPLLSMISTDQWYGKRVIVSAGPLINRSGLVEKWGNGWVSVAIDGVSVHNRRSFELFLHPEQNSKTKDGLAESFVSNLPKKQDRTEIRVPGLIQVSPKSAGSALTTSSSSEDGEGDPESASQAFMHSPVACSTAYYSSTAHLVSPQTTKKAKRGIGHMHVSSGYFEVKDVQQGEAEDDYKSGLPEVSQEKDKDAGKDAIECLP